MKTKIQADTTFGIYSVDEFEGDVISQEEFYASLTSLGHGEIICAEVDFDMLAKINEEYGVSISAD